jgi:hypothetical protein
MPRRRRGNAGVSRGRAVSFGHCAAVLEEPPRRVRVHGVSFGACLNCVTACLNCVTEHIPKVYGTYTEGVEVGNGGCKMCYGAIHRRCIDQNEGCSNTPAFGAGIMLGWKRAGHDPSIGRPKSAHFAVLYHPFRGWYGRRKIGKKSSCNTRYNTPQRAGGGACARGRTRGMAQITQILQVSNPQMSKIWQRMTILSQFFSLIIKLLIDYDDFFPMIFWEEI